MGGIDVLFTEVAHVYSASNDIKFCLFCHSEHVAPGDSSAIFACSSSLLCKFVCLPRETFFYSPSFQATVVPYNFQLSTYRLCITKFESEDDRNHRKLSVGVVVGGVPPLY